MISVSRVVASFGKGRRLNIAEPLLDIELTEMAVAAVEAVDVLMEGEEAESVDVEVGEWGGVDDPELDNVVADSQESPPGDEELPVADSYD